MNPLGPIAIRLEEEVKRKIRQHGVVVWLDKHSAYSDYVDDLVKRKEAGDFPFPVVAFRGSYLEMMLTMEPYGGGNDREPLLIHLPGHTEDSIRETPFLEMYRAGSMYKRAVATLLREVATGRVPPDEIEIFLKTESPNLNEAEQWLAEKTAHARDGLAGYLESLSLEWLADGFFGEQTDFRSKFADPQSLNILADHLYRHTGMDAAFLQFFNEDAPPTLQNLGEAFAAWLMCVEYIHDLSDAPILDALKPLRSVSDPLRKTCLGLVAYFRDRHPDAYAAHAMTAESHLNGEIEAHTPEALGQIDTFNKEQERILQSAVQALRDGEWEKALHWTSHRIETESFWLKRDPVRRMTWYLILDAARLGDGIEKTGRPLKDAGGFDDVLEYYTSEGWKIDNAHRRFEQQQMKLLDSKMPHFTQLHEAFGMLRSRYRKWADTLALDFSAMCEREGFLPESGLRQREIYQQVIHPLVREDRRVVFFLIDAFRFEMAAELMEAISDGSTRVSLKGRYCELPSITAVGMNALAPVARNGRLILADDKGFNGFKTGEYTVRRPEDRTRAMGDRSLDNIASGKRQARGLNLADVCNRPLASLKKACAGANLIVIHSREIDDAGGANVGTASFEVLLRQIRTAWNQLRSLDIQTFVFTADHGFQLLDHTTRRISYGSKKDPESRYVLTQELRAEEGLNHVSLTALGYEGGTGYLLFPKDTAVFATGRRGDTFVHGGNSLQERVVPVLTVSSHRTAANTGESRFEMAATAQPDVLGFSRIQVSVVDAPHSQLRLAGSRLVTMALRAPEREDVQVTVKEASGTEVENQAFQVRVNDGPVEIIFDLTGPRDERVRLEVFSLESGEIIAPVIIDGYFNVSGRKGAEKTDATSPRETEYWQGGFEDATVRKVFVHLFEHGAITETELNGILGSPRKVRRFALTFEEHAAKAPFSVRIETTPTGKRYVKE